MSVLESPSRKTSTAMSSSTLLSERKS